MNTIINTIINTMDNNQIDRVYIMRKDGSLKVVGEIHRNTKQIEKYDNDKLPESVVKFNNKIFYFIANDRGIENNPNLHIVEDDIQGHLFEIIRYRRCTVYLVIQISTIGVRYLAYIYDKIIHNGQSFGTDASLIKKEDIINKLNFGID